MPSEIALAIQVLNVFVLPVLGFALKQLITINTRLAVLETQLKNVSATCPYCKAEFGKGSE